MAFSDDVVVPIVSLRTDSYAQTDRDLPVVWLNGEHDAATVEELSALLAEAIASTRSDVIVDLGGVGFMGAAPLGVIVRAREFLERRQRALVLRAPSSSAQLILDLCGVDLTAALRAESA